MLLEALAYSRQAVADGEGWRLLGASFAHLSTAHLLANAAGLLLLALLLRPVLGPVRFTAVLAGAALGVPIGVHAFTTLDWYVGLSGALHALLAHGALRLRAVDRSHGIVLLAVAAAQVAFDQTRSVSWLGEPLAPQSHLIGFAIGLAIVPLEGLLRQLPAVRRRSRRDAGPHGQRGGSGCDRRCSRLAGRCG